MKDEELKQLKKSTSFKRRIIDDAVEVFWKKVAEDIPGASQAGLDRSSAIAFTEACEEAIDAWIENVLYVNMMKRVDARDD